MRRFFEKIAGAYRLSLESIKLALGSLPSDKFRTTLSLLGVAVGIFSIVAILCAINAVSDSVREEFEAFGADMICLQTIPWDMPNDGVSWTEYLERPFPCEQEFDFLRENLSSKATLAYFSSIDANVKGLSRRGGQESVLAVSADFDKVIEVSIEQGRYFSPSEFAGTSNVAVIGCKAAERLYGGSSALGKRVKIGGAEAMIIGVFKEQGSKGMVNIIMFDDVLMIPLNFGKMVSSAVAEKGELLILPKRDNSLSQEQQETSKDEFLATLRHFVRSYRRLSPSQKDNFAINEMTFISNVTDALFWLLNALGWVVGTFSLLIGGFGIANIMFVSVKERTHQIGIQKALGARRYVITMQYLTEAVLLSVLGGLVGIVAVWIVTLFVDSVAGYTISLSLKEAFQGVMIAAVIGAISGWLPARSAAKMSPVKAIASK